MKNDQNHFGFNDLEKRYPLSPIQQGVLFNHLTNMRSNDSMMQHVFIVNYALEDELIKISLKLLGLKHSILRSSIEYEKAIAPMQVIIKDKEIEYEAIDLSDLSNEIKEASIASLCASDRNRGFDIKHDTLLRVKKITLNSNRNMLLLTNHCIVMDGESVTLVYEDILFYYNQLVNGKDFSEIHSEIESDLNQYADYQDYIHWLNEQDYSLGMKYWDNLLADYDDSISITPMHIPKQVEEKNSKLKIIISNELSKEIISLAQNQCISVSTIFETALGLLLQRYNYTNDVVYGKVTSRSNKSFNKSVGLFTNILPIRIKTSYQLTLSSLLKRVLSQWTESQSYNYISLNDIQAMTRQRNQLFNIIYSYVEYSENSAMNDNLIKSYIQTAFPFFLVIKEKINKFLMEIEFDSSAYEKRDVGRLLNNMTIILQELVKSSDLNINMLQLISLEDKNRILNDFNHTDKNHLFDKTIIDLFEEQVKKTPNNIAVIYENHKITYDELNNKANQVARKIRILGIQPDDLIVMLTYRSIEMIIGMLAILKSGAAFVPINLEFPKERIEFIIKECSPKVILTNIKDIEFEAGIPLINLEDNKVYTEACDDLIKICGQENLAYCLFTSGTTGNPKGVLVKHRGLQNAMVTYLKVYGFEQSDVVLQFSNYTYAQAILDIFNIIIVGGTLSLISEEDVRNPLALEKCCSRSNVTFLSLTPTMIAELNPEKYPSLRILDTTGEAADIETLKKWLGKRRKIFNSYGSTELSGNTSSYIFMGENIKNIPIGKPVDNIKYYIVDIDDRLCGIGMPGELCVSGLGLARGYLNNPVLTKAKFVDNPYAEGLMYRTGDLAKWLPDGNVECIGRIDDQVKIRGCRVELGEIKSLLRKIEYIDDCAVIVRTDKSGDKKIHAYLVSSKQIDPYKIQKILSQNLPEYEIPTHILQIAKIPLNKNGKLDKSELPELVENMRNEYLEPDTDEERLLCKLFSEIFCVDRVGIEDNFFQLGGDSIKSIRLAIKIKELGYEITVNDIMKKCTIKAIAQTMVKIEKRDLIDDKFKGKINTPESDIYKDCISPYDLKLINDLYKK